MKSGEDIVNMLKKSKIKGEDVHLKTRKFDNKNNYYQLIKKTYCEYWCNMLKLNQEIN